MLKYVNDAPDPRLVVLLNGDIIRERITLQGGEELDITPWVKEASTTLVVYRNHYDAGQFDFGMGLGSELAMPAALQPNILVSPVMVETLTIHKL